MDKKIFSIQGLRAIAFIIIFFYHTKLIGKWGGTLGVSIFFVISGFVITYTYLPQIDKHQVNAIMVLKFGWNRIKKILILYEILTFISILGSWLSSNLIMDKIGILRIFSCIFLIQAWIPSAIVNYSFIGASWFLSALLFCYFMTIPILKVLDKLIRNKPFLLIAGLYGIGIFLSFFLAIIFGETIYKSWEYTYVFPPIRLIDYMIGCCIGYMYIFCIHASLIKLKTPLLLYVAFMVAGGVVCSCLEKLPYFIRDDIAVLPISFGLVFFCVFKKEDIISYILSNRMLVFIGDMGTELFLLHPIIIRTTNFLHVKNSIFIQSMIQLCVSICVGYITFIIRKKLFDMQIKKKKKRKGQE